MSTGKVNIWRWDVLSATVACINDGLPVSIIRHIPGNIVR